MINEERHDQTETIEENRIDTSSLDELALFVTLKDRFELDFGHSRDWRNQAKKNFDFAAGRQWEVGDKQALEAQRRPAVTFNRTLAIIKAIAGLEINGRHETVYMPQDTEPGTIRANEILTDASRWMSHGCDAEDEQSAAFQDTIVTGMGWTEGRIDYERDPEGMYVEQRIDTIEMVWDRDARSKNLADAKRLFRVRKMPISEARAMFPGEQDEDLDAPWATGAADDRETKPIEERRQKRENNSGGASSMRDEVHIVHCQWYDKVAYHKVAHPETGELVEMSSDQFQTANTQYRQAAGTDLKNVQLFKRVYKQAFLGAKILGGVRDAAWPEGFTWQCITGEPDRNKGYWFGLVDLMRDPQQWANKWLSQTLHILNTTAKGGIIAESDAFKDIRQAQDTYAQPDAITWVTKGAISGQKIMPKPGAGLPTAYVNLLEFAISSIRDVTGINLELLGMRDANQPGILEAQRKQSAMTILSTLFDSLRRFRKQNGRLRLYYIQNFLADGRLIRISTEDGPALEMLKPENVEGKYEIIVEEAPTSPNSREQTWGAMIQMMPVLRNYLTPESALAILDYSPLPAKLVNQLRQMSQQPPSEDQQQQKQLAIAHALADIKKTGAQADQAEATAESTRATAIIDLANAFSMAAKNMLDGAAQNVMTPEPWKLQPIQGDYAVAPPVMPQAPPMQQMPGVNEAPPAAPPPFTNGQG